MKKIYSLFLFLLCFSAVSYGQDKPMIEPELQCWLDGCNEDKISVTIVMKSQAEASAVRAKAAAHRDRKVQRTAVVNEFKAHSNASQMSLLSFLQAEESKGNVANIASLWISNSIACDATREVICAVASRSDVAFIGLDKEVTMIGNTNNDMLQTSSARVSANSPYPHVSQVNAPQVWEQGYTGKNVVVAILDSGINDEHCDLKDHLWQGYADTDGDGEADDVIHGWNYISNNANIKDDYGHGTHCAGIICGDGTVGNIAGVAPDATLMTLKIVNRSGGGSPAQMIKGIQFAVENGASILSISSGFKASLINDAAKENLRRAFEAALEAGVIAFVAAGNDGNTYGVPDNVDFPAACPPPYLHPDQQMNAGGLSSVVCVGAVDADDKYASFSSQGPVTWQGTIYNDYLYDDTHIGLIRPDICAPGDWIHSLKHDENDKYKINSGTSQATPCVAGVAALMLEKNNTLTPADICRIMENTAKKLSEKKNNLTGSGRVDALKAVEAVEAVNGKPYIRVASYAPDCLIQGDDKDLCILISNNGRAESSDNTTVTLSFADEYITIDEESKEVGSVGVDELKDVLFSINVHPDTPNGHTVYMTVNITDGTYSWSDELMLKVNSYAQIISEVQGVTRVDAGKDITIDVKVINSGTVATTADTKLTIEANTPYVQFVKNDVVVGTLAAGEAVTVPISFKISDAIADNSKVRFDLYAVPNNYTEVEDMIYEFEVGMDDYGYLEDGFNDWTTFDASNDGRDHSWWHSSRSMSHSVESTGKSASGKGHLMSETYCQASRMEYEIPIDNYLVSPRIRATDDSKMVFKARVHSSHYFGEHFGIAVSEKGKSDAEDFTTIKEWTINKEDGEGWIEYIVDLSAYSGKEIYVAIRHFFTEQQWQELDNGFDVYVLHVDDVELNNVIDTSDTFKNDNYSSFLLWVNSSPLSAPENLVAKTIDKNSVSLSWDAVNNAQWYSLYRNGIWIKNVYDATTYTDTELLPNTTYRYTVAACANGKEYGHSNEASAKTLQEDYIVSIKSITPDALEIGENVLSITMINDGKYEQEARSGVILSTNSPYVVVSTGSVGINALYAGQEVTKEFYVNVDDAIPNGTVVEFNLNITQKYEPYRSWNHTFTLKYVTDVEIADTYCTLYAPVPMKIPANIEAYVVTEARNGYAMLKQIYNVIPANTGVVLKGGYIEISTENTYIGTVEPIEDNLLKGTNYDMMIDEEAYVLACVDGKYGFYKAEMNDGKFLNNSNKAYLPVSAIHAGASMGASLRFDFNNIATSIEDVEVKDREDEIYDFTGRRINTPVKGMYIINGKKVVIK